MQSLEAEKTQDDGAAMAKPEFVQNAFRPEFAKMQSGDAEVKHCPIGGHVFAFKDQHPGFHECDGAANGIYSPLPYGSCTPAEDSCKKQYHKETDGQTFGRRDGECEQNNCSADHDCGNPDETATQPPFRTVREFGPPAVARWFAGIAPLRRCLANGRIDFMGEAIHVREGDKPDGAASVLWIYPK